MSISTINPPTPKTIQSLPSNLLSHILSYLTYSELTEYKLLSSSFTTSLLYLLSKLYENTITLKNRDVVAKNLYISGYHSGLQANILEEEKEFKELVRQSSRTEEEREMIDNSIEGILQLSFNDGLREGKILYKLSILRAYLIGAKLLNIPAHIDFDLNTIESLYPLDLSLTPDTYKILHKEKKMEETKNLQNLWKEWKVKNENMLLKVNDTCDQLLNN